jgi:N6-adenosine-specific RNA methylase IME4
MSAPFTTGVIDPPWPYSKRSDRHINGSGYATDAYQLMGERELAAMDISSLVGNYLFMWTTSAMMPMALRLAKQWGFTFRTLCYWHKSTAEVQIWRRLLVPGRY